MIILEENGEIVSKKIKVKDSFFGRLRGLMFAGKLENDECLLFKFNRKVNNNIHTWFVFQKIDVLFLDEENIVVDKVNNMSIFKTYTPKKDFIKMIELPNGKIEEKNIKIGDKIKIKN